MSLKPVISKRGAFNGDEAIFPEQPDRTTKNRRMKKCGTSARLHGSGAFEPAHCW
jgi:hypothetical protein